MDNHILIAGAGPTGLAAALELTRLGIAVTIVDPVRERSPFSKALAFNPRSQQLMAPCGLTGRIREQAREITGLRMQGPNGLLLAVAFDLVDQSPNTMLVLPQAQTEALMETRLAEMGIRVRRGWALQSCTEKGDRILATLVDDQGAQDSLEVRQVLGADGAHSRTRSIMQQSFPGDALSRDWALADIEVEDSAWRSSTFDHANLLRERKRFVFVLPVSPGLLRVVSDDLQVLENLPALVTRAGPGNIRWQSQFRIHHRLVPQFRLGALALAGDAAHVHSPVGGRGMNMGIEDACFFARCVAENRMGDYHRVRHARARRAIRMVRAQTRMATRHDPLTNLLLGTVAATLFRLPFIQREFALRNMGLK